MVYEALQAIEVFSLIFSLAALSMMINFCWKTRDHCLTLLLGGYFLIVMGILFSSLESVFFPRIFNLLEHLCRVALPALLFARAAYKVSEL